MHRNIGGLAGTPNPESALSISPERLAHSYFLVFLKIQFFLAKPHGGRETTWSSRGASRPPSLVQAAVRCPEARRNIPSLLFWVSF